MRKSIIIPIIILISISFLIPAQANASSPSAHFTSSPVTTWYNQTPYKYVASISTPENWTLKTDAPLRMSDGSSATNTSVQTVFGVLSTGSYWVNISIFYSTQFLTYQNFTITVSNTPFIYSTPETFFYPDQTYNYTYEINQGNITGYSSGFTLNKTDHTLSEYLSGSSYSFYLTVSDKNRTYTQYWGVSSSDLTTMNFEVLIGSGIVNVTAPISGIGFSNITIYLNGTPVFTAVNLTYSYSLNITNDLYYSISASSPSAQDAILYFNFLPPGGTYRLYLIYDGGTFYELVKNITVPSDGIVSFTFAPYTMQDPIVELVPYIAPPPTPPAPIQSVHTGFNLSGLDGILILVGIIGVLFIMIIYVKRRQKE